MPAVSARPRTSGLPERSGAGSSKSLQKALRILLHMGERGQEIGVTQLAAALGLNKTTVYRLLSAMQKFELIEKNSDSERYRLGLRLYQLGTRALEARTLRGEAHRLLVEMSRRSEEAVSLAVPTPAGVICMDRMDSPHTVISVRTAVGAFFPAHATAAGKAVLAYLPAGQVRGILKRNGLAPYTSHTITRAAELTAHLGLVRARGYALDQQELERGLSGVAAPVLRQDGQILGALGIAGPTPRFRGDDLARMVSLAKEIAARLGASLGLGTP